MEEIKKTVQFHGNTVIERVVTVETVVNSDGSDYDYDNEIPVESVRVNRYTLQEREQIGQL